MKCCKECTETKELTEFYKVSAAKDGLDYVCKECRKSKNKSQNEKHKEARRANSKIYRDTNKDKISEQNKKYREKNREELNQRTRDWRAAGNKANRSKASKDKTNASRREHYAVNEEFRNQCKARAKAWKVKNPERAKQQQKEYRERKLSELQAYARNYTANRRAKDPEWHARELLSKTVWRSKQWHEDLVESGGWIRTVSDRVINQATIKRLHAWQQDHCYFCLRFMPKNITVEHILPRDRGGPSIEQNIVLTCESCNYSRQNKIFYQEWIPSDVEIHDDKFLLTPKTIGQALDKAGINCELDEESSSWILRGDNGRVIPLFIVSTFFSSTLNAFSKKGKIASWLQGNYENPIVLFDREWYDRQGACINMLKAKLGMSTRGPGARQLDIVYPSQAEADAFMDEHHVMGKKTGAKIRIGLHDGSQLYAVGLFSEEGDTWENDRLALRGHVPGAMSRIMKAVWNTYGYRPIRSFVDSRYATGEGHESIGFKNLGKSAESYQWVFPDRMQHQRYLSNDSKMSSNLLYFNPSARNDDNIISNGIYKIWTPKRHTIMFEK